MLMFAFNSSAASIYSFTAADMARLLVLFTILHDWSEKIMQKKTYLLSFFLLWSMSKCLLRLGDVHICASSS